MNNSELPIPSKDVPRGCPFCNKKPSIANGGPMRCNLVWYAECDGEENHTVAIKAYSKKLVIAAWNKRGGK